MISEDDMEVGGFDMQQLTEGTIQERSCLGKKSRLEDTSYIQWTKVTQSLAKKTPKFQQIQLLPNTAKLTARVASFTD